MLFLEFFKSLFKKKKETEEEVEIVGKWFTMKFCSHCQHQMTDDDVYFNKGVCPYCGEGGNYPICKTIKKVVRYRGKTLEEKQKS